MAHSSFLPEPSHVTRFFRWWRNELVDLAPKPSPARAGKVRRGIVLSLADGGYRLLAEGGAKPLQPEEAEPFTDLDDAIAASAHALKQRAEKNLTLRLAHDACFSRVVELPSAAHRDFARILAVDLVRATPFQTQSIYTAHFAEAGAATPQKTRVRQLVIKRSAIEEVLSRCAVQGILIDRVECWDEDHSAPLPVNLLQSEAGDKVGGFARLPRVPVLALLCVGLAVSGAYLSIRLKSATLDELKTEVAAAEAEAKKLRQDRQAAESTQAASAALNARKAEHRPRVMILEELTRVLPDSAWAADVRVEQDTIELTGYAASAAELIPLLGKSPVFAHAELTAPVTLDPQSQKERFSIRVRLRSSAVKEAVAVDRKPG